MKNFMLAIAVISLTACASNPSTRVNVNGVAINETSEDGSNLPLLLGLGAVGVLAIAAFAATGDGEDAFPTKTVCPAPGSSGTDCRR
jgi:hypothetical protein